MNWLQKIAARPYIQNYVNDRGEKVVGVFDSFAIKEQLKPLGFRWDNGRVAWSIPEARYPAVQRQVETLVAGPASPRPTTPSARPVAPPRPTQVPPGNTPTQPAKNNIQPESGRGIVQTGIDGKQYVCINIPYAQKYLNETFKAYGFRFNWGDGRHANEQFSGIKAWIMPLDAVKNNPQIVHALQEFQIPELGGTSQPTETGQAPSPTNQPLASKPWSLAHRLVDNQPLAVRRGANPDEPWLWEDIDYNDGSFLPNEVQQQAKLDQQNGQEIRAANPDELLDPIRKKIADEERAKKGPVKPDPSQQAVIDAFIQGNENLMMNALAGTGKTSTLVYLAKIKQGQEAEIAKLTEMVKAGQNPLQQNWQYIKPQDEMNILNAQYDLQNHPEALSQIKPRELKWFYLVFNKKNQIEGQKKFDPAGIPVKTTHSFLGDLLANSDIPDFEGQALWSREESKRFRSKERMGILCDRMLDGSQKYMLPETFGDAFSRDRSYRAKQFVRKLANYAKNYAVNPSDEQGAVALFHHLIDSYGVDDLDPMLRSQEELKKDKQSSGGASRFVDFTQPLIEDTLSLLKWCLPGQAASMEQQLRPQREQDVARAESNLRQARYRSAGDRKKIRAAEYQVTKAKRNLAKLGVLSEVGQENYRDHNDTLWFTTLPQYRDKLAWDHYDCVLADEVQDFNFCQHNMIHQLAKQKRRIQGRGGVVEGSSARIMAVGDPHQSMYRFRGADRLSFNKLEQLLGTTPRGGKTLPLIWNHRCGEAIINYANENTEPMAKLPQDQRLKADDDHKDPRKRGQVHTGYEYEDTLDQLRNEWNNRGNRAMMSTAFIARGNAPLAKSAIDLMKAGLDFEIIGRDFAPELVTFIADALTSTLAHKNDDLPNPQLAQLKDVINGYVDGLAEGAEGDVSRAEEVKEAKEYADAMGSMIDHLVTNNGFDPRYHDRYKRNIAVRDADGFRDYLLARFEGQDLENSEADIVEHDKIDPRTRISLTTGHRSKGLEWDRVFMINQEDFPSPNAKTEEDRIIEGNIKYVVVTRAMKRLYIVNRPKDKEAQDGREGLRRPRR